MRYSRAVSVAVLALAAVTAVGACGSGGGGAQLNAPSQDSIGKNDINPHPASDIKDGGTLQWPIDTPMDNWNRLQVDGTPLDNQRMQGAVMPSLFTENPDSSVTMNKDYLDSAEVTAGNPQVVEYKINPKARWSNGRSFSWEDFQSQWQAANGRNPDYQLSDSTGYENITKVERGSDDLDVKVTYAGTFGEWQNTFTPLYPKELTSSPEEFNKGWVAEPKITAGPFKFGGYDQTSKTVTLTRDPSWWGTKAHLDSIVFKLISRATQPDALASGAIDFADANGLVDAVSRFKSTPNVAVRQAVTPDTSHITTNGAAGRILSDQKVRIAVLEAIDRKAIANAIIGKVLPNPPTLGNHFFPQGSKNYKDHSDLLKFDKAKAAKDLDEAGWKLNGQTRAKDGKELALSYVSSSTPAANDVGKLLQQQLGEVGVKLTINAVPTADFFKKYINVGDFDLTNFRWFASTFPLSGQKTIYKLNLNDPKDVQQNYGHVGNQEINDLYDKALAEPDEAKRVELTQQVDELLWKVGGELPLYQIPGATGVKTSVANWGAIGFAYNPIDYAKIGFLKTS
ncbi:ABC transporter family substrate-binding protein [Kutzneria viridogrisea]|uniref:Peptide/nickel transport system substrate-binding protein n=1 Tax=Kutzneria viridogrisea TaxID=47990 RepID=A0ABR6BU07_9PSEU|nr:peptide/nickel transport system substrate-binding protein [Kutzneria viridogrisea]